MDKVNSRISIMAVMDKYRGRLDIGSLFGKDHLSVYAGRVTVGGSRDPGVKMNPGDALHRWNFFRSSGGESIGCRFKPVLAQGRNSVRKCIDRSGNLHSDPVDFVKHQIGIALNGLDIGRIRSPVI
jgi:hypothetical protein